MKLDAKENTYSGGTRISMAYPSGHSMITEKGNILAGDLGGKKTNLALYRIENRQLLTVKEQMYQTADFKSFSDMACAFHDFDLPLDGLCLGVAGPVTQGKVHGTNFRWDIDRTKIAKHLNLPLVCLINDMEANAYGLSALTERDLRYFSGGPMCLETLP